MTDEEARALADTIRVAAFATHRWFRSGFLEKVYENSLARRLRELALEVEQQHRLPVYDEDGSIVGDYVADLLINKNMILELKAVRALDNVHLAQTLAYLRAARLRHAMLINFGAQKLEIRKLVS
jgi:GxxExxY protein